jgi:hypothetical protein
VRKAETCISIDVSNKELLHSTEKRLVILTDKPKEIAPSGTPKRRLEDVESGERCEEESSASGQGLLVGRIRHGNDSLDSTKSMSLFE